MTKWYCELSESYHDTLEEAQDVCREFMEESDYIADPTYDEVEVLEQEEEET